MDIAAQNIEHLRQCWNIYSGRVDRVLGEVADALLVAGCLGEMLPRLLESHLIDQLVRLVLTSERQLAIEAAMNNG